VGGLSRAWTPQRAGARSERQRRAALREELERRFAVEVASWIARKSAESPEAAVVAFADPRFLGHLRGACSALRLDVAVERGEFSWLRPAELGAHPSIRAALGSAAFRPAASP
jgi:hypothetical protein